MCAYTPPYQLTDAILRLSTEIAATVKEITVRGNLSAQPQLHRANRIRSVHSSLAIEHNSLTLDQVTALLNGKRVLAPQQEVWEVQNAFRAYDLLPTLDPYSIDDLLKVHRVMMDGLVMGAGTFRNTGVGVYAGDQLIHADTPAQYVPEAMQQLFEWLQNTTAHPLVASCVFHYEFEFIHPFADGNGRMGRLWHTLLLAKWKEILAWIPVETLVKERQQEYYDVLGLADKTADSTYFVEFMLTALLDALTDIVSSQNSSDPVTDPVTDPVEKLLAVLNTKEMSITELMSALNVKHKPNFRKNYLQPALQQNLIEMTVPEKPNSPKQKYRKK